MIDEVLISIQNKLAADVPELKDIDEDWGQLDNYQDKPPVKFPCCLISVKNEYYQNMGQDRGDPTSRRQLGDIKLRVKVANGKLTNSNQKAPIAQRESAFFIHTLKQKVHDALHGWRPTDQCGFMLRESVNKRDRGDQVQEYEILFSLNLHNV